MSRPPKKSDSTLVVEKEAAANEVRWSQRLRENLARVHSFNREVATLQQELASEVAPGASNCPKGFRVVDYNTMREAQIFYDADERIKRGICGTTGGGDEVYAEPAESFHIRSDRVPGPPADPNLGGKPASWAKTSSKKLHERAKEAAKVRAAEYQKDPHSKSAARRGRARTYEG
jgi:hypothetical protein